VRTEHLVNSFDVLLWKGAKNPGAAGFDIELGQADWNAWIRDDQSGENLVTFVMDDATPLLNQWHHLAVVIDRPADKVRAFLDGVIKGMAPTITTGSVTGDSPLCFGDNNNPSRALLDEVKIQDGARGGNWILTTYQNAQPGFLDIELPPQ
jgi:hypothetical protein